MIFPTLFSLFLFFSLFSSSESANFNCPTQNITGGSGTFPPNENNIVQFPAGYECTIGFSIQPGFVVKLTMAANVTDAQKDLMVAVDTLGKPKVYTQGIGLFVAPATTAYVAIQSLTGQSQFWFRYEYIYVSLLERVQYHTGEPFPLNIVPAKSYTITSPKQNAIVLHTSSPIAKDDPFLLQIFVYDGVDVNSPYIGTLYDLVHNSKLVKSSSPSFTLLNQYGTYSSSYAIANDYIELLNYAFYSFHVFDTNTPKSLNFQNTLGGSQLHTFYCIDQSVSYISALSFNDRFVDGQTIRITPQSPTNPLLTRLTYLSSDNTNQYMPQQIPGNLFTVTTDAIQFTIGVQSDSDIEKRWRTPRDGRMGTIYSPSLWTVGASPAYSHNFEYPTPLRFTFNIQSAVINTAGEQLSVKIGTAGSAPFTTTFTNSVSNPGVRVANGTYMLIDYTGTDSKSSSIVTFQMDDPNGKATSTMPSVQTSTKSVDRFNVFGVFLMILMYTYQ